jgi:hypothetical protein
VSILRGIASRASNTTWRSGTARTLPGVFRPCFNSPPLNLRRTWTTRASRSTSVRSSTIHSSDRRPVPAAKIGIDRYVSRQSSSSIHRRLSG